MADDDAGGGAADPGQQGQGPADPGVSSADIFLYGAIGGDLWDDGMTARDLAEQIAALDVDRIRVYINSVGGAAWDGLAIMNALRRHPATVTVIVDALAASAASVVAMAGDHVVMNRGAEMMIHDASGMAWGNADDMRATASVLDKLSDSYADAYAARAGGDRATWRDAMRAETWYTAEEAVAAGLADEWVDAPPATATAAVFDLTEFRYPGRAAAPAPTTRLPAPEPEGNPTKMKEVAMSDSLKEGLRHRLGITDSGADDSTILAALDERLKVPAPAAPDIPDGVAMIDEAVLASLREDAAAGRQAMEALAASRRDEMVDEAVRQGRIAPAARQAWREMADRDEGSTRTLLASLEPGAVPVTELGFGATGDETASDDELYMAAWGPAKEGI